MEGSAVTLAGSGSDPEGAAVSTTWSLVSSSGTDPGASCVFGNAASPTSTVTCTDDGTYTLRLTVSDGTLTSSSDATLTIANVAPTVSITAPVDLSTVPLTLPVTVSAPVADAGSNDTLSCTIGWGDGTTGPGTIGNGMCTGAHTYAAIGVPEIVVTVTDDDGGSSSASVTVTVSDQATQVTGGGYLSAADGGASFAFVARNAAGALTGQLQLNLAGTKRFHGNVVTAMTVTGTTATWSGTGSLDGVPGYRFTATAVDNGSGKGKTAQRDQISLTVWAPDNTKVGTATGPLAGGNLTVHK